MSSNSLMGKILHIDLSTGKFNDTALPSWLTRSYIGGKGIGAKLLLDLVPDKADSLGPENVLMFLTGPLTSTSAPAMRACVVTKSPLTNSFLDSYFGGYFGPEIKYAGYDGLIFTGKSPEPVYLHLDHTGPTLKPAKDIWGQGAIESSLNIKKIHRDSELKTATIGPAGENMVPYALICCDPNRQAGRGGAGAVMGSKNLKALAVKGNQLVRIFDHKAFNEAVTRANEEVAQSLDCQGLMATGTAGSVEFANETGLIPARNFSDGTSPLAAKLGDKGQAKKLWLSRSACFGCPIACSQMGAVRSGKFASFVTDIVEYETAAMLGTNLEIGDPRAVAHLNRLCDELGLDTISAGASLSFAFEAAERGLISHLSELKLEFGNVQAAAQLIRLIAHKKGKLGELLAMGVKKAAQELGDEAESLALHVKGMEMPAWGPRGTPGMGLAYMTADRGACHQRGFPVGYEATGMEWKGKPVKALDLEGKAELVFSLQNYLAGTDCLVKCDFGAMGVTPDTYALLLNAAAGTDVDGSFFNHLGERIWNTTRLFNIREGMDTSDEKLPRRFVEEPLKSGPYKGHRISQKDMKYLIQDYYKIRGWDEKGLPARDILEKTGVPLDRSFSL
ncbi:aldehyde ferredoxin oxidoreductase family protein [Desulfonatronovibrio hydrogenovorans]|uniref:aldehyde ferredoxin oxidoreductase family protein n=1 Tax=Desulfonatronovibrio hydrogenovorans TaxID=53245 RepID=UPI00048A9A7F|nr:aldehyde ferredoxin oxidoreductase family protein [Desulfonatronovibrio hydrogenovorans]